MTSNRLANSVGTHALLFLSKHRQLVKFGAVGLLGAFVDFGVYTSLTRLGYLNYMAARSISVMVAILHNFLWNKYWTFNRRMSGNPLSEYARFLLVSLLSMSVNLAVMFLIIEFTAAEAIFGAYEDIFAMSVAIITAFLLNFHLNRSWTFR